MDLLLIGGVSGSGKNVALGALEDSGYYAVNNLPLSLVEATADYLAKAGRDRVAIALDAKIAPGLAGLADTIARLRALDWNVRFLYLDAKTETLVKRFSETRRRHPFSSDARTLTEAIDYERALLSPRCGRWASCSTRASSPSAALRAWIKDFVSVDAGKLTLQLESFGFKHGVPLDADLVFDVRCLPNPHYEPALQPLTGRDVPVVEFLEDRPTSSGCTATSSASSRRGFRNTPATTATTSPSRSDAPAAGTARCISSSGSPRRSRRRTRS